MSSHSAGLQEARRFIRITCTRRVEKMIFQEENFRLPMSLQTLTRNEWAEIWAASPMYGWGLVEPPQGRPPKRSGQRKHRRILDRLSQ